MSSPAQAIAEHASNQRCMGPSQFNASNKYRAEWIHFTPPGFRDEPYDVAFSFSCPQNGAIFRGFPTQLDDDADYHWRGFFSSSLIGLGNAVLYDPAGRPLSAGLAYNFGGLGFGTFIWPIDQEIICTAGAVLLMDLQLQNLGGNATISGCYLGIKRRRAC